MALDAATFIRAGTAALVLLLGLAILVVGRRRLRLVLLGGAFLVMGTLSVINNLWLTMSGVRVVVGASLLGLAAACLLGAAWTFPHVPRTGRERQAVAWGALVGLLSISATLAEGRDPFTGPSIHPFAYALMLLAYAAAGAFVAIVGFRLAAAPATFAKPVHAVALAASIGIWWSFQFIMLTDDPSMPGVFAGSLVLAVGWAVPWFVASARAGVRSYVWTALLWPALTLLGRIYAGLPMNADQTYHDAWGLIGVFRIIGWSVFVYAILRHDLLGVPLPHFAVNRGAIAAGALATLFIVAQVAQNFFNAEFGLYTGGAVAGAFLFVAAPVQRAFERIGSTPGPDSAASAVASNRSGASNRHDRREAAFRDAVVLAYRDRRFDDDEELALMRLADVIGLPAERAAAIRLEVQRTQRGKGRR